MFIHWNIFKPLYIFKSLCGEYLPVDKLNILEKLIWIFQVNYFIVFLRSFRVSNFRFFLSLHHAWKLQSKNKTDIKQDFTYYLMAIMLLSSLGDANGIQSKF